ncbi:DNA-directed RNA polymerase subunit A', partial [Candidatus Parvarchaeota archaeon]|nr:DNA-directed RNA polymerase subunit A' [Candidatus Parvarchaeota archaeon]
RQPSLHRCSIMCHEVKVLPGKTLRLNPSVNPPYNADFDGDEMNLHVIQSEEARVEAQKLMKVRDQIISPRHGRAIIKPQEDHVSGAFFLTRDGAEFTVAEASQLLAIAGITKLPKPDKGKNYSGKLLFSMMLPSDLNVHIAKSKLGESIVIKNGILLQGSIESKAFENEILEKIFHAHGSLAAARFIDTATRVAVKVVTMQGLSVSLANYSLSGESQKKLHDMQSQSVREIDTAVMQYKNKTLVREPGRTLKESLEDKIMMISSKARESAGSIVEKDLGLTNTSVIMAKIGARGSLLNAIQMAAMLGQQAVRGKRVKRGFKGRTLPHYKRQDIGGSARGYVMGSFRFGLDPRDFYHHSMGGRESLVNTAIRTARSGYMQRRLINALQDLVVSQDLSVRDSRGVIVQYTFGGDGADPMKTMFANAEGDSQPREETDV